MARRRIRAANPFAFWTDLALSSAATAVTLSVRLPQLAAGTMTAAESKRMVGEKVAAAAEGLTAGAATAARIGAKRMMRPAPHRALHDLMEIAEATSRPARRRVKANATRLSSQKSGGA